MLKRSPAAGGFLLIVAIFAGIAWGIAQDEPSLGFLYGLGAGILIALAVWLIDRRRG